MNKLYKHNILGVFGSTRVRSIYAICKNVKPYGSQMICM